LTTTEGVASQFLYDLRQRLANRVQLTGDGHKAYLVGIDYAFSGINVDYAMLLKLYGEAPESAEAVQPSGVHRMREKGYRR